MRSARYPLHKLDAIFNHIGVQLELAAELDELGKNDKSDLYFSGFLREITNGEYIWALYEALRALTDVGEQVELSPLQDAILSDIISGITARFFDQELQSEDTAYVEQSKQEIWDLYELAKAQLTPEEGEEQWKAPGHLKNEDWEIVFELITEVFDWETEWYLWHHFSLIDPYPHIPNDQEYRLARFWLISHFEATAANR